MAANNEVEEPFFQWSKDVLDFSSQYGSETSISYTVTNLAGESTIYPNYGDFTQACVLRTYGPWWKKAPSTVPDLMRTPDSFVSHDFIDLSFIKQVYPVRLEVNETYNPGAIVRILACDLNPATYGQTHEGDTVRWAVLWAGECQRQPAESTIFMPDLRQCPFKTNLIRLELNSTKCEYYTELDAVGLHGMEIYPTWWSQVEEAAQNDANIAIENSISAAEQKGAPAAAAAARSELLNNTPVEKVAKELANLHIQDGLSAALEHYDSGYFELMPDEVIQLIISYLDITSLCNLSLTCQLLYKHCYDPLQFTELNMQPYWSKVRDASLEGLHSRCTHLQRLNFSWCGCYNTVSVSGIERFMQACGAELLSLNLSCCRFVDNDVIRAVAKHCPSLQVKLSKLRRLVMYRTMIDVHSIIAIIRSCQNIEHLNLGSCIGINSFDDVAIELGKNCKKLKSLDIWRAKTFSDIGLQALSSNCQQLEELDIGWCSDVRSHTKCIVNLAQRCKMLKKLFLTANRTICDNDLDALAKNSVHLQQLDILGTREVSQKVAQSILENCKEMIFFDVSFCSGIDFITVDTWKQQFPKVGIKKSFQT